MLSFCAFSKNTRWLLALLILLAGCQPASPPAADYLTTIPDPRSLGRVYVSDPDQLLDAGTAQALNARLDSLDHSGRAHIDVVLVNSIGGEVPKTAATALFNKWKIGRADTDNGLLLLLVVDQHRIEMETGYGLEDDLPDILCYRIQQRYMLPPARAGNYGQAVRQGVAALIRQLAPGASLAGRRRAGELAPDSVAAVLDSASDPQQADELPLDAAASNAENVANPNDLTLWLLLGYLLVGTATLGLYLRLAECLAQDTGSQDLVVGTPFLLAVGLLLLALFFRIPATLVGFVGLCYALPLLVLHVYFGWQLRGQQQQQQQQYTEPAQRPAEYLRRQRAHLGLDFTAWLFPVGLAWYWPWYRRQLQRLRRAPLACPTCTQAMHLLDATAELPHLDSGQQSEQRIASVDYDVWLCANGHALPLAYLNPTSKATPCPACQYRTFLFQKLDIEQAASIDAMGWGWHVSECCHCHHQVREKKYFPRLLSQSRRQTSSSSSSSSWGSGSSGSSGSWGDSSSGGSSGGGGAGSSW